MSRPHFFQYQRVLPLARLAGLSVALTLSASGAALAQAPADAESALSAIATSASSSPSASHALPLAPNPAFSRYPQYHGHLGERQIVMRLGPKADDPEGLDGEVEFLSAAAPGRPHAVVLVAGDRSAETLTLEESDDGTRISGQWIGVFASNGSVSGERLNNDDSVSASFELHPAAKVSPGAIPPSGSGSAATRATNSQGRL